MRAPLIDVRRFDGVPAARIDESEDDVVVPWSGCQCVVDRDGARDCFEVAVRRGSEAIGGPKAVMRACGSATTVAEAWAQARTRADCTCVECTKPTKGSIMNHDDAHDRDLAAIMRDARNARDRSLGPSSRGRAARADGIDPSVALDDMARARAERADGEAQYLVARDRLNKQQDERAAAVRAQFSMVGGAAPPPPMVVITSNDDASLLAAMAEARARRDAEAAKAGRRSSRPPASRSTSAMTAASARCASTPASCSRRPAR